MQESGTSFRFLNYGIPRLDAVLVVHHMV